MRSQRRLLPALLFALLALAIASGASAAGSPQIYWSAWWTVDVPAGFWSGGDNTYSIDTEWTYPGPGTGSSGPHTFSVSSDAALYQGFVLVRIFGLQAASPGGAGGLSCDAVDTIHPDQPTRALMGWINDDPMTRDEFASHITSMTVTLVNHETGAEAPLAQTGGILRWATEPIPGYQPPWVPQYTCRFTRG